jgi:fibronectin type 3 domain-containing protein
MSIHNRSGEQTYTSTLTGQPTSAGQEDTTVVSEIPAAPTGLELDVAGSTASLDWDDNTESDLAGYNVYRSTRADGVYQKMNSSLLALSSFTDSSADEHTAYYYYVTAMDTDHNESGHLPPVVSRYLIYLPLMLRNH